jgi:hypothetical protein
MHHRPPGLRLIPFLRHRLSRLAIRQPVLLVSALVLLVAAAIPLIVPART